jgi:DNA adenine methylase
MTTTPFRYPGAKNKMLPILMEHLSPLLDKKPMFLDAFVGGGSVLLDVAEKYPSCHLFANDKDYWVYCFWNIVSGPDSTKFDDLLALVATRPTLDLFYKLREEKVMDDVGAAYRAIFFNRTTFSGIFYSGPIGGKDQNSQYTVDCRYNIKKLLTKILKCRELLQFRTVVVNEDFTNLPMLTANDIPTYLDPPYYVKGDSLYIHSMKPSEHRSLSHILANRKNWVLSYDDCPEIRDFYKGNSIIDLAVRYCINGKKSAWENKNELIILAS